MEGWNILLQWSTFTRCWWLYDAKQQCVFQSSKKIAKYLEGKHKPIWEPLSDVGDHVVVINVRDIAMKDSLWKTKRYEHHTGYRRGYSIAPAWMIHDLDPLRILKLEVYGVLPKNLKRPNMMQRLHLYPDENVPDKILMNVSDQISQVTHIPRALEDYTQEEKDNFPKLFQWPKGYEENFELSQEQILPEKE